MKLGYFLNISGVKISKNHTFLTPIEMINVRNLFIFFTKLSFILQMRIGLELNMF